MSMTIIILAHLDNNSISKYRCTQLLCGKTLRGEFNTHYSYHRSLVLNLNFGYAACPKLSGGVCFLKTLDLK